MQVEDLEFKASLSCIMRICLQKQAKSLVKEHKQVEDLEFVSLGYIMRVCLQKQAKSLMKELKQVEELELGI